MHGEKWAVPWQILDAIEQASRMRCTDGSLHRPCGFYKQDNLMPDGNSQINVHVFLLRKKIRTFLNFERMRERAGVVCRKGGKEKKSRVGNIKVDSMHKSKTRFKIIYRAQVCLK